MKGRGLRLGRVAGIEIQIDWSLAIVFVLVAANLGLGVLPEWHPGWPRVTTWIVAFAAAALFFASVLAHELAHSLVGRAMGIRIERITLFFLGGVAHLEEPPKTAKGELVMAIAGPLMSLAIGVLATIAGVAMVPLSGSIADVEGLMSQARPLPTLLLWLGPINIVLGLFNMLPGFPLDGGRVLRASLWWLTGDHDKATAWAGRAGKAVAFGFFGVAVVSLMGGATVQGIWFGILGFFLYNAARAESAMGLEKLKGLRVTDVMRRIDELPTGRADAMAESLLKVAPGKPVLVVDDAGRPIGLADATDLARYLQRQQQRAASARASAE